MENQKVLKIDEGPYNPKKEKENGGGLAGKHIKNGYTNSSKSQILGSTGSRPPHPHQGKSTTELSGWSRHRAQVDRAMLCMAK